MEKDIISFVICLEEKMKKANWNLFILGWGERMITKHGIEITWRDRVQWWWEGDHDYLVFFGVLLGSVFIVIVLVIAIVYPYSKYSCGAKAEKQGFEWSFGLLEGCMIKTEDGWLDYGKWIGITREHKRARMPMRVIK